jgi:anaerobic selenocysteine-containing dehydrogenase
MLSLHKTICPLDCPDSCGLIAVVEDGRVTELRGDREHPVTRGVICRKMRRYPERLYGPERVLHPQLRVGKKGEGLFRRISWEEAYDVIAKRFGEIIDRHGSEAILPYAYAGNMGMANRFAGFPFFHRLGASRLDQTICSAAASAGWGLQCGDIPGCPPENAAQAELIVAWGINIKVSNCHFWPHVAAARRNGGRLLVIDPYRNDTARSADHHVAVLPGGDPALALGVLKVLVDEGLVDQDTLKRETEGFAAMAEVLADLQWSQLERESGVSRQAISELAALLAAAPRTFVRIGIGLSRHSRGGMAVRLIAALAGALGLFDGGPGRGVLLSSGAFPGGRDRLSWPSLAARPTRLINMIHLGHALTTLDPPLKGLFVFNANPASANPDGSAVRRGLCRDDLFTVVHEQVMSATARYADLLLPATTFLENLDLYTAYGHFYMGVARPVIPPLGEAKSNFQLFAELAARMGFDDPPFRHSCEERIVDFLRNLGGLPPGIDLGRVLAGELVHSTRSHGDGRVLRESGGGGFSFVASGGAGPSVPCLTPAGEAADPDLLARYPLRLIAPPHPDLLNSTFGERYAGRCGEVFVHPDDARRWQVAEGEQVELVNHRGRASRVVRISDATRPGVLVAEGIYWPTEQSPGINDLTSQKAADLGGGATFHETLVAFAGRDALAAIG